MRKRNADGTWRSARKAIKISERVRIARWVEAEILRLKRLGLSFDDIAEQITKIGRGTAQAMVTLPDRIRFPPDYRISRQACCKAFRRAITREPNLAAHEMRLVDTERCENMFLALQSGIRKGDPRSIEVGVKVLSHRAEINGFKAAARVDMTGPGVTVLVQQEAAADAQAMADLSRLTLEELREYRRLEAKTRAAPHMIEIEATRTPEAPQEVIVSLTPKTTKLAENK
jgi:hypothetical protein